MWENHKIKRWRHEKCLKYVLNFRCVDAFFSQSAFLCGLCFQYDFSILSCFEILKKRHTSCVHRSNWSAVVTEPDQCISSVKKKKKPHNSWLSELWRHLVVKHESCDQKQILFFRWCAISYISDKFVIKKMYMNIIHPMWLSE